MRNVILRFKAKDERTARAIIQRFYDMCVEDPKVFGWGLLSEDDEE